MPYDPQIHHRRSMRLRGYDYTQAGAYFVTICTHGRECLFGELGGGEMRLGPLGEIVAAVWEDIPRHFPGVELDAMVVMPNHMHGIIVLAGATSGIIGGAKHLRNAANASPLRNPRGATGPQGTQPGSLAAILQNFKSVTTRKINATLGTPGARTWQRNYYEHIVRDEADLRRIREYIAHNPANWATDRLNR